MGKLVQKIFHCRFCLNKNLIQVINLGDQPAANAFLTKAQLTREEHFFPLKIFFCKKCGLLQLTHVVSPDLLFRNYVYVSSTSPVFVFHFEQYAKEVFKKLGLVKEDLVLDIGSNDGILLRPFKKLGAKVLGVDPAIKIAKEATKSGIETIADYFTQALAKKIYRKYGSAKVITANNVFAHVPDIEEMVKAIKNLLDLNGVLVIEAPYLVDFLEKNLFDTIYHEHVSYLSIKPLTILFARFDMEVFDVEKTSSHGGSIRVYVKNVQSKRKTSKAVSNFIKLEEKKGLGRISTYQKFAKKINQNKESLNAILRDLKKAKKNIAGYGAPAKGNTLLNYFNINAKTLDYIIDDSKYKQGLFTPGMHIPVKSKEALKDQPPDYLLLLAWNFAESIMKKIEDYKKGGGKFIIPVPTPKII